MQLDRAKTVPKVLNNAMVRMRWHPFIGFKQPVDCRQQEVALPRRWLQNSRMLQHLVRRVPDQVQDEINNLASCENRAASFDTGVRHARDRGFDRRKLRK
jgi:hypothetical protein